MPNLLEDTEDVSVQMSRPMALASGNDYRTKSGMRVLRTSPIILVSCGILFASLIFLLDLRAQTDTRAEQKADASRAVSNSQAKNQAVAVSVPEEKSQANVPVAMAQPSATPAALTPAPAAPSPASQNADQGNYTLQVGSFNDQAEAGERVARLGSLGIQAYVARVEIPGRGTWYRVQTGSFSSREEAARFGTQLRNKGTVPDFISAERRAT